ncbi:MAG: MT-A70 family methyltransferase, partial [Paracoccaceae bacterium]
PPWQFASNSKDKPSKNTMRHYPCMNTADIANIPVAAACAKDALLLLWVTVPFTEIALDVVKAWGFAFKSELVWPKERIATGYWARNKHEKVLICRKGLFPCLRPALFPDSIIPGKQGKHSAKPDYLHEITERRFPDMNRVEMFARRDRMGWHCIGNETQVHTGIAA